MAYGWASVSDYVDNQDETITPQALRRATEDWAPFGNIRGQHDPSWAVGTIKDPLLGKMEAKPGWEIRPHPETGTDALWLATHIVDDKAIKLTRSGVFGGFSIGGKVNPGGRVSKEVNGRKVNELTSVTFSEISIVDRPANDLATVERVELAKRSGQSGINVAAFDPDGRNAFANAFRKTRAAARVVGFPR